MGAALAAVGHNQPPGPIEMGQEAIADLSTFLSDTPVIQSEEDARQAKVFVDRIRATLGGIEDARVALVKPLNDELSAINDHYKSHHNTDPKKPGVFDKIFNELKARLTAYAKAEEDRRFHIAEEARLKAVEAERLAREAEQREQSIKNNAAVGEIGADVGAAIQNADSAFADFERSAREAARAEKDIGVRIGGGFSGRALSMRTKETLTLDSYSKAIKAIGPNDKIRDAILSAARDYRKLKGTLPDGVSAALTREI
jgi:hypothetical protein